MGRSRFTTKELSKRTWDGYVRFFSAGNGWDHCGCVAYQGFVAPSQLAKWADKRDWSLQVKHDLVERGLAHGVLVYAGTDPVGWCQYGPPGELPLPREKRKELLGGAPGWKRKGTDNASRDVAGLDWKITCFCADKSFACQGIASIALRAALIAIAKRGGGLVEARPVAVVPEDDERVIAFRNWRRELRRLIRAHGRFSVEVERHLSARPAPPKVTVKGIGEVDGIAWAYGAMHPGTVGMFQREGFTAIGSSLGRVIMQKNL